MLRESVASALGRERLAFDRLTTPFNDLLILFGAGGLGKKTVQGLRRVGIKPLAFADNNRALWGSQIEGLPVLSPQEAAQKFGDRAAFVITIWGAGGSHRLGQTRRQLCDLGCLKVADFASLFWKYPFVFLPYYALGLPHLLLEQAESIREAMTLWADQASRYEYLAQMRWRLQLDFDGLPSPVKHAQYFPPDLFDIKEDEIFVDCGAYDGDSLRVFMERQPVFGGRWIAIEPDPLNLRALAETLSTLPAHWRNKVDIRPLALGSRRGKVRFELSGLPSSGIRAWGGQEVECVPLEEILGEVQPTFIKMDIEGAEMDALIGARRVIEKHLPVLAICVYHQPDHLWRIPLLIRSFSDQYRYFLRTHNEEGWDLVCYAIPVSRLKAMGSGKETP